MLQDVNKTLERLLIREGKITKSEIDIAFDQPTGEWSSRLSRPSLNLWCFDLRENVKLRNMERRRAPGSNDNRMWIGPPPRRMDITYLVTAWTRKVEDEHQLLWRALTTLKRFANLKPEDCVGSLRDQSMEMPVQVADLSDRPLNLVDLWGVLDNQMRVGFTVIVTVELDLQLGYDLPLVLEPLVRVGRSDDTLTRRLDVPDVEITNQRREEKASAGDVLVRILTELGYETKQNNSNGSADAEEED